jgi:hypothetical protein
MGGGDEPIKIEPGEVQQTAQGVATALGQAAEPGPVPAATGASPIDLAAGAAATTVIGYVAAGSADLAPRGGEVLGAADTALAGLQSADSGNAADLSAVGQQAGAQELPARPGAATAPVTQAAAQSTATSGLGQVEQAVSSAASAVGSPLGGLGSMSPGSALSGAPLSSLAGSPTQLAHQSAPPPTRPAEPPANDSTPPAERA